MNSSERIRFLNEACVAYGTLALAIVTGASVWETQRVVASEDRRHQQAFAPLLLMLMQPWYDAGDFKTSITNQGSGLALEVTIVLEGQFVANVPGNRMEPIEIPAGSEKHSIGVVTLKADAGIVFPSPMDFYFDINLTAVTIKYLDMFGNPYETRYLAYSTNPNEFEWVRPKNLDFVPV